MLSKPKHERLNELIHKYKTTNGKTVILETHELVGLLLEDRAAAGEPIAFRFRPRSDGDGVLVVSCAFQCGVDSDEKLFDVAELHEPASENPAIQISKPLGMNATEQMCRKIREFKVGGAFPGPASPASVPGNFTNQSLTILERICREAVQCLEILVAKGRNVTFALTQFSSEDAKRVDACISWLKSAANLGAEARRRIEPDGDERKSVLLTVKASIEAMLNYRHPDTSLSEADEAVLRELCSMITKAVQP